MANTSLPWLGKMRRTFFIIPIHHNHHRPSIGYIMNFGNQKMLVLDCVFEIKKIVSGRVINEKETQNGSSMWYFRGRFVKLEIKISLIYRLIVTNENCFPPPRY